MRPSAFIPFLILFTTAAWSQAPKKKTFFVPQVSVRLTLSGDMNAAYQFAGPLGESLTGVADKPDACEASATFHQVRYREKRALQMWLRFKCAVQGQAFEFKPQRLFVDVAHPEKPLFLPAQSEKFKKIAVQVGDLTIKDRPPQK